MKLRPYQETFVYNLSMKLRSSRKIVAQLATGGGKTICFSAIAERYTKRNPDKAVLILVHRKELLLQTRKTLYNACNINAQLVVAGMKYIPPAQVYLGMVESVNRRVLKLQNVGLVIIDEAHIAAFNKMHPHFPEQFIIGFTATPLSSSRKNPMNLHYDDIVCGIDIADLIDLHKQDRSQGLCQNITYAPKDVVDRAEISVKGGEFDDAAMAFAFSKPKFIHNTVEAYEKIAPGEKAIIFNVNIPHSQAVNAAFVEAGYPSKHLDSNCEDKERKAILKWFHETPGAILNNVGIATTGFDEPTIEVVIVNKATLSLPLWLQMTGRGGRPTEVKSVFKIIDMGGNAVNHGDWSQSRNWTDIFYNPPRPGDGDGIAPVKSCPSCDAIVPASAKECSYCGNVFPTKEPPVEERMSEFVVLTKGIDVYELMKQNSHLKEFYTFFEIGRKLVYNAKKTVDVMTDEIATFILQNYYELGKQWMKARKQKLSAQHKLLASDYLMKNLKTNFPEWEHSSRLPLV